MQDEMASFKEKGKIKKAFEKEQVKARKLIKDNESLTAVQNKNKEEKKTIKTEK